jgi:ABC-2 type transport system permease protein
MSVTTYWKETKYEFLKRLRVRAFVLSTLGFPLMFYVVFGLLMNQSWGPIHMSKYLLATYGVFGVAGVSLFGFGVSLAIERGLGWLELKQASPMPPAAYLVAKLITYTLFSVILLALMFALGFGFGHVQFSPLAALHLFGVLIAGAIPFGALGLVLGYLANASSAPSFINAIYLPMSFCSGLWMPFEFLPKAVRHIAPFLPTYHLSQLAVAVVRGDEDPAGAMHWGALAGFTLVFIGAAMLLHRRSAARQNGLL